MNEREWVRKNCKFAQMQLQQQPPQPMPDIPGRQQINFDPQPQPRPVVENPRQMHLDLDDESRHWTSFSAMRIVGENGDSETERQYGDDPSALEPGTVPGALMESYWKDLRLQGEVFWSQELQQESGSTLEDYIKISINEGGYPKSLEKELDSRYDKVEVTGIQAVPAGENMFMVNMAVSITGEREIDESDRYDDDMDY